MEKFIPSVQLIFVLTGIVILISLLSLLVSIIMEMLTMILDTRQKTLLLASLREREMIETGVTLPQTDSHGYKKGI